MMGLYASWQYDIYAGIFIIHNILVLLLLFLSKLVELCCHCQAEIYKFYICVMYVTNDDGRITSYPPCALGDN